MSRRTERVGRELHAELARLLQSGEVTDPRLAALVLTHVDVSPDLASARVYWSTLPAADAPVRAERARADAEHGAPPETPPAAADAAGPVAAGPAAGAPAAGDAPAEAEAELQAACAAGLTRAAGFLRSLLAKRLPLRRVPELHFFHDPSQAEGSRVLSRIAELSRGAKP